VTAATVNSTGISPGFDDTIGMQLSPPESLRRLTSNVPAALRFVGRLGFGRQGALAATRRMFPARAITPLRRGLLLLVGALLVGTGVALLTQADLGLSPFDVLVSGLQPRIGLSFGQTVWVISAALFLIAAALGQRPSRWGIAYVLAIGSAVDAVSGVVNSPGSLLGRSAFVLAALFIISAGISLVVHSGSTGGAFELLMKAGEERGRDRRLVRLSLEFGVLVVGVALGGKIGVATIVIAIGIGPVLGLTGQALADYSHGRSVRLIQVSPQARHPSLIGSRRH